MLVAADECDPYTLVLMDWSMPDMNGIETARIIQDHRNITHPPVVIMVTAYRQEEAEQAAGEVNVAEFLIKPVTPSSLFDVIMRAMGHESMTKKRFCALRKKALASIPKLKGARVLLVEDNEINQELVLDLLTANGLEVTVANHGKEALALLDGQSFDGVLMDCQMPVMDGYTATRKIREQKRFEDLPIIAMTANALVGDRQKVLSAGMNDYISKPFDANDLFTTLAMWIVPDQPHVGQERRLWPDGAGRDDALPDLPGVDTAIGLAATQNNPRLYQRLLRKFSDRQKGFEETFRNAQQDEDPESAKRVAHTLKGLAGTLGAMGVQKAAHKLEMACRDHSEFIDEALEKVLAELKPLLDGLETLDETSSHLVESKTAESDNTDVEALIAELYALVSDDDTNAVDLANRLSPLMKHTDKADVFDKIAVAVSGYDFNLARELFKRLDDPILPKTTTKGLE